MKKKYRCTFNWSGETYTLFTSAERSDKAFHILVTKLSKLLKVPRYEVLSRYWNGQVDNYYLEEVK